MMNFSELGVRHSVFVKILMVVIFTVGIYCFLSLPRYLDPDIIFNIAVVTAVYRGAGPEDVESAVTIPLEEELKELDNIDKMTSVSMDGAGVVVLEHDLALTDMSRPLLDLSQRLDQVMTLPSDAEEPFFTEIDTAYWPICQVVLAGPMSEQSLDRVADRVSDDIERIPGVGSVDVFGERDREIWVEVDRLRMESYGFSLLDVARAVGGQNANVPSGDVDVGRAKLAIRVMGEVDQPKQLENLILHVGGEGGEVRLSDMATVRDTFEEATVLPRLNGERAVVLNVKRKKYSDTIGIIDSVRALLDETRSRYGAALKTSIINDTSQEIRSRLNILSSNAMMGMVLVVGILAVFLGPRNAVFAFLGIPVSFLVTFILMKYLQLSIDGVSLFAMILVLGMLVDDAIIVLENIHRRIEGGENKVHAAIHGAREVAAPVISSTLTTIAAFAPLLLVSGLMGRFIVEIPLVVIIALSASLLEAFFMMPSHVAEFGKQNHRERHRTGRATRLARRMQTWLLKSAIRRRYILVPTIVAGVVLGGWLLWPTIQVEMFPPSDVFPRFDIQIWMPVGTQIEATDRKLMEIQKIVLESLPAYEVEGFVNLAGFVQIMYDEVRADHVGTITVMLHRPPQRMRDIETIVEALRPHLVHVEGINELRFERTYEGPPTGAPVHLEVQGESYEELEIISNALQEELRKIDGVYDIKDNYEKSRKEIRVRVDESRARLAGLDSGIISATLRGAFDGIEASVYHADNEEVEVRVRLREEDRKTVEEILNLRIRSQTGGLVPLKTVAEVSLEPGPFSLRRIDGRRTITVTANLQRTKLTSDDVTRLIQPHFAEILGNRTGYSIRFGGEYAKTKEAYNSIFVSFGLAVLFIYLILSTQFRSFIQPVIIMSTVPLAGIGVVIGLLVMHDRFTFPVMIGLVALAGVVVNDALVLIDFINRYRAKKHRRIRAVLKAGRIRVRPILLTTITTVGGLLPMALGLSGRSPVWEPLATSIVWGLSFATLLTLFVIPVTYMIVDDIGGWFRYWFKMREPHEEIVIGE